MKISFRGWIIVGAFAATAAALAWLGVPRANAAEGRTQPTGQLTEESLGNMLAAMGLQPEKTETRYDFTFRALHGEQEWDLSMSTVLSRNGRTIWVIAWLDELPRSAAEVPRIALLRLLAQNDRLGSGKFFAYIPANRRFVLQRVVPNRNITSQSFRNVLRDLGSSVVETYPQWHTANWTKQEKKPGPGAKPPSGSEKPRQQGEPGGSSGGAPPQRQATGSPPTFRLPVRR